MVSLERRSIATMDIATMCSRTHYVRRSWSVLGTTLYPVRMLIHLSLCRLPYNFWRSRNISWRTTYLMAVNYWISLASREAVPILSPAQNLCSVLWYLIAEVSL